MGYSRDEKETVLCKTFDEESGKWVWDVYSNVPKDVNKLMKIGKMEVLEKDNNHIIAVRGKLDSKQVSLRMLRELTEEERLKRSEQMRTNLQKMKEN